MLTASFLTSLWFAMPTILSTTDCPEADEVSAELALLLPTDKALPGTVVVDAHDVELSVDLQPSELSYVDKRSTSIAGSCQDRANSAAVMIATWWPLRRQPEASIAEPPVGPRPGAWHAELGATGYLSAVTGSTAYGARAEIAVARRPSSLGARLGIGATGSQSMAVGLGKVEWMRLSSELGPTLHFSVFQLDAGAVLGAFRAEGTGHVSNRSAWGFAFGATVGTRVSVTLGRVSPWFEARGIYWPQSQRVYAVDLATGWQSSMTLPKGEIQVGLGIAFSLF